MTGEQRDHESLLHTVTQAARLYLSLSLSSRFRERFVGRADADGGIAEARILWELDAGGGARSGDLAQRVEVSAPAMTKSLARLRERGLVEQRPDLADGRAKVTVLTERGRREAGLLTDEGDRMTRAILAGWSEEERRSFAELLSRFARGLDDYLESGREPGPPSSTSM